MKILKPTLLALAISSTLAHASSLRNDINLQVYRDFAENKGEFIAGATDITITDKNGKILGKLLPDGVPVPIFSATSSGKGILTLVAPQFVTSVQHNYNTYFKEVEFGTHDVHHAPKNRYHAELRNDYETKINPLDKEYYATIKANGEGHFAIDDEVKDGVITQDEAYARQLNFYDFNIPKLNKMVTEVAPTLTSDSAQSFDPKNYAAFMHVGGGAQEVIDPKTGDGILLKGTHPQDQHQDNFFVYRFLTASAVPRFSDEPRVDWSNFTHDGIVYYLMSERFKFEDLYDSTKKTTDSPLAAVAQSGDSGSGLYGFNKLTKQWELVGLVASGDGQPGARSKSPNDDGKNGSRYTIFDREFMEKVIARRAVGEIAGELAWQQDGDDTKFITDDNSSFTLGKHDDLYVDEDTHLKIKGNVVQKSGGIHVGLGGQPTHLIISGGSHKGGGVNVANGSSVNFSSQITAGDYLAKLGEGTLVIDGNNNNQGGISVGDGVVYLSKEGQAANYVELASGRGTVVLDKPNQVKNNDFRFGHRGGVLDIHGQTITTDYMHNVDDGGIITNRANTNGSVIWKGERKLLNETKNGINYILNEQTNDLYILIGDSKMRTTGKTDNNYVLVGTQNSEPGNSNKINKKAREFQKLQGNRTAFSGKLGEQTQAGKLDFVFDPKDSTNGLLLLTGGSVLNGKIKANDGKLVLAGRPTPRAFDHINQTEFDPNKNTWIERSYQADSIEGTNNAVIKTARGANVLKANIVGSQNASFDIGFSNNASDKLCIRSDYNGLIECSALIPNQTQTHEVRTSLLGDATLTDRAKLQLTHTDWTGSANTNKDNTITLNDSKWQMNDNAHIGNLTLSNAQVHLSKDGLAKDKFNTLTVQGDLTGYSDIYYRTHIKELKGDKVTVEGKTAGTHTLYVSNSGKEPAKANSTLSLFETKGGREDGLKVTLHNQEVDLGAYRYVLGDDKQKFYLYSPMVNLEAERKEAERKEAERKEAERKEAERKEAERKEAERKEAERKEAERKEAERKEAERKEAERKEAERKEAERKEAERKEAERKEAERKEAERKEAERKEAERKEAERKEAERKEAERKEAERKEAERKEAERKEAERKEAERKEAERKEAERKEAERKEAERKKQKDYISRYTNAALSDLSLHTNAVLDMGTTLVENMLVGHHTPIDGTTQNDIWYSASKSHAVRHQSESYRPYERDFNSRQIGIRHQEGVFGYGGALTHTKSLAKLTDDMQAKHDSTLLSGFAQYHHDNATIVVDAGIGNIRADIETIKNSRRIVSAGLAAKYQFGQDIQVIPSIYVRHNWIQGTAYQLDGADIVLDKVNSNQAGADVRVQKTIRSGALKITPSIYVGGRFVSSKAGVMVNNQHFGQSIGNSHHIGGGMNVSYDRFTAGFDVKQRHGDEFDKQSQADISMSYHW